MDSGPLSLRMNSGAPRSATSFSRDANYFPCPHGVFHLQAKALARVFVENHQPFQSPTSFGLVENKIVAPYMIPATSS